VFTNGFLHFNLLHLFINRTRGKNEFFTVERWLCSFTKDLETAAEKDESRRLLDLFLGEPDQEICLTKPVLDSIKVCPTKSFCPLLGKLSSHEHHTLQCFGVSVSSANESENARLKKDAVGPRSNQTIDQSGKKINNLQKAACKKKNKAAAAALDQSFSQPEHRGKMIPELVDHAGLKLNEQMAARDLCIACSITDPSSCGCDWNHCIKHTFDLFLLKSVPTICSWLQGNPRACGMKPFTTRSTQTGAKL